MSLIFPLGIKMEREKGIKREGSEGGSYEGGGCLK